jgi:hypothetical protein
MLHKGQLDGMAKRDILAQNRVINQIFGLEAWGVCAGELSYPDSFRDTSPIRNIRREP